MKKGQGLSLNTIIIAAIVLIVLIVLWAIFTGRMGGFTKGVGETENCGDICKAIGNKVEATCDTDSGEAGYQTAGQTAGGEACCCKNGP